MDPAQAERLKWDWTDKRVTVSSDAPTLRRFRGHLGTVMTVNMNGRALVRFDGTADIGWYDIALSDLTAVAAPPALEQAAPTPPGQPPVTSATKPEVHPAASQPPGETSKGTAKPSSILELARRQGAAKS
ncbi:MAG: hypothetical protein M3552_07570 [Planctomycetota bacterium]|nr:hypothetical protein [Planctomycetaceae bacterium]MDQ3330496.1 hypothetical protein [Planctomycetota bacterium]